AEAERELQFLALHRRAVADAADLQPLLETLGDAGHEIVDQGARQSPHRARALGLGARRNHDAAVLHLGHDVVVQHDLERALRPLHLDLLTLDAGGHALRHRHRLPTDARHVRSLRAQNTVQRISPPTFWSRASWSAITPFGVDRIDTPSPLLMRGRVLT